MRYPFADTPENRHLADLIDRCVDVDVPIHRQLGRYSFHVLPHAFIARLPGEPDYGLHARTLEIGLIDRDAGTAVFAPEAFESTAVTAQFLKALREGDLAALQRDFPQVFNLHTVPTYLEVFAEMVAGGRQIQELTSTDRAWLVANGSLTIGMGDPPLAIAAYLAENTVTQRTNRRDTVEGIQYSDLHETVRRGCLTTISTCIAIDAATDTHSSKPRLTLAVPTEQQGAARRAFYSHLQQRAEQTAHRLTQGFLAEYQNTATDTHQRMPSSLDPDTIRHNIEITFRLHESTEMLHRLHHMLSPSPDVLRNRLQLLARFQHDLPTYYAFVRDPRIQSGIDAGAPLREVLAHLPVINVSAATLNGVLDNFHALITMQREQDRPHEVMLTLEKGPAILHQRAQMRFFWEEEHTLAALIRSLPETPFQYGPQRNADGIMQVLDVFPKAAQTLSARIMHMRQTGDAFGDALSWVPGWLQRYREHNDTPPILDTARILHDAYYTAIVRHLHYRVSPDPLGHTTFRQTCVSASDIMDQLVATGEYRYLLRASQAAHRLIQAFYRDGQPDVDLTWEPVIPEPWRHGDLTITPIASNFALIREGALLQHCVASYFHAVTHNVSYVFSVTRDGEPVSTLELQGNDPDDLIIAQHQGHYNTSPPEPALDAAKALLAAIQSGEVAFNATPVDEHAIQASGYTGVEREEIEAGCRFRDRQFIIQVVRDFEAVAPGVDLWGLLAQEGEQALSRHPARREAFAQALASLRMACRERAAQPRAPHSVRAGA